MVCCRGAAGTFLPLSLAVEGPARTAEMLQFALYSSAAFLTLDDDF